MVKVKKDTMRSAPSDNGSWLEKRKASVLAFSPKNAEQLLIRCPIKKSIITICTTFNRSLECTVSTSDFFRLQVYSYFNYSLNLSEILRFASSIVGRRTFNPNSVCGLTLSRQLPKSAIEQTIDRQLASSPSIQL